MEGKNLTFLYSQADTTQDVLKINNNQSQVKKTLESPLDCKEIQPVHPKGDQSWVITGRTDGEAEMATSLEELTHWKRP